MRLWADSQPVDFAMRLSAGHPIQMGVATRHNQKTVTVITDSGQRWNVSPQLLRHASEPKQEATSNPNIIRLPER